MQTSMHQIEALIAKSEGLDLEFKTCRNQLNRDVYETLCAFLNRHGGTTQQVTQQVALQVTQQVARLLTVCTMEMSRAELMQAVNIRDRVSFSRNYLDPALAEGLIEMTPTPIAKDSCAKVPADEKRKRLAGKGRI